ncbi:MAG: hypothetical protein WA919_25700 [Coleofasciculaceae cyanobacterium]
MNIQELAEYYVIAPNYQIPSLVVSDLRQLILELGQTELQGIEINYVDFIPYLNGSELSLEEVFADFNRGKLMITTQFNESDLFGSEVNLIFRAIHEVHHLKLNVGFDWEGEFATAVHLISLTDNLLFKQILFSETIGQVAVRMHTGRFPYPQKVVLFELQVLQELGIS